MIPGSLCVCVVYVHMCVQVFATVSAHAEPQEDIGHPAVLVST